jgi:hypothetical protein
VSAKNKKVRFETKAARRTERAERAGGGKAARRTKAGGKRRKKIPMG